MRQIVRLFGLQWRRSGEGYVSCPQLGDSVYYQNTLTRLTFTAADRTEIEFRDALTNGAPHTNAFGTWCGPGFNRGMGFAFPGIAVDRSNGPFRGRVYLTWNESIDFFDAPLSATHTARTEAEVNDGPFSASPFAVGNTARVGPF